MLQGDIVKDERRKIMDVLARLPGCDGQAADAVSAYTQVNLENAPRLLKNSQIGMS